MSSTGPHRPAGVGTGASARYEMQRSLLEAAEYDRLAALARSRARRYARGALGEQAVGARLEALTALDWRVLPDRRWGRRANIDFLLVGPGGILVVDVKNWAAPQVIDGHVYRDGRPADEALTAVSTVADLVVEQLGDSGLVAQAVRPVLVFAGRRLSHPIGNVHLLGELDVAAWATRLGTRLSAAQIAAVADRLAGAFPAFTPASGEAPGPGAGPGRVVRPAKAHVPVPLPQESLFDVQELTDALLDDALAGPIEEWMSFLHPDQNRLVHASWNGPARVRGAAGTGKTVVGLHRAVHLAARHGRRVLFVTFVRTLPIVQRVLCGRLAPQALDRIQFLGVHQLAGTVLDAAGIRLNVDGQRAETIWNLSWSTAGRSSVLAALEENPGYWRQEVDYVIKGRGLLDFDDYAALARVGRKTPLRIEHREAMWRLYEQYERRLREAGVHDFNDMLIQADHAIREGVVRPPFDSIVVDEVQDLTLVGLRLLHDIAGDGPDGLLLIGDGQQAIYPGGFTLAEADISVAGRAAVLRANYRNTAQIVRFAQAIVADDQFDDLDGDPEGGQRDLTTRRNGPAPQVAHFAGRDELDRGLVTAVDRAVAAARAGGSGPGDLAVLVEARREVERLVAVFRRHGVPVLDLADYAGTDTGQVRVGTFKRAKGLEFKQVFLPGLREQAPVPRPGESDAAYAERGERHRRELFVGMTRARDRLWVGYLAA